LPYYCKSWVKVLQTEQAVQIEQLQTRLIELKHKVGSDYFDEVFEREVPSGTIKPQDNVQ
jgi:hypothetical protein